MAKTRRSRGIAPDGVVRHSVFKILTTTLFGGVIALLGLVLLIGAIWERDLGGKLLFVGGGLALFLGGLHGVASVWIERVTLMADTVEARFLFDQRSLRREDVIGVRRGESGLRLCSRHGEKDDLEVMWRVIGNRAWAAWLETLRNFTLEEASADRDKAEGDERLGRSVEERRGRLTLFRRINAALGWLLLAALVASNIFWTDPYWVGVVIAGAIPILAIGAMLRWSVLADRLEGLIALALIATLILALRAMLDVNTLDVWPPRLWSIGAGLLVGVAWSAWRREDRAWKTVLVTAVIATPVALWAWAVLSFANLLLDGSAPRPVPVVVVERIGKANSTASLTLRGLRSPYETFKEVSVSPRRFERSPPGTHVCLNVRPGVLRWRWGQVRDCPPGPARAS